MKSFLCFAIGLVFSTTICLGQYNLEGFIYDEKTDDPLIGTNIVLSQNGVFKYGTVADLDGMYNFSAAPGTYDIKFTSIGYPEKSIPKIKLSEEKTILDIEWERGIQLETVIITSYSCILIEEKLCPSSQITSHRCYGTCRSLLDTIPSTRSNKKEVQILTEDITSIYPNPASQVVTIEANQAFKAIHIFSVDGKLIFQQENLDQHQLQIPVNTWTAGMYLVHYCFEDQTTIKQLIVESEH